MQNQKAVSAVLFYWLLTTVLSSCSFLQCNPRGKIQFKDFIREDLNRHCYDTGSLFNHGVCAKHGEVSNEIKSKPTVAKVIDKLRLVGDDGKPLSYKKFIENLDISHKRQEIISISYQSSDKQQASAVVNTLMKTYVQEANRRVNIPSFMEQIRDREKLLALVESEATKTEMSDTGFTDSMSIDDLVENLRRMNNYLSIVEKDSDRENYDVEIIQLAEQSCSPFLKISNLIHRFSHRKRYFILRRTIACKIKDISRLL